MEKKNNTTVQPMQWLFKLSKAVYLADLAKPGAALETQSQFTNSVSHLLLKKKKIRIRETKNLSTDADRRTDTILERLLLGKKKK